MQYQKGGFTIVELLIVIVVIGILAAITIVAFNGVQERANTTAVTNDLKAAHKKLALYRVDSTSGGYPTNTSQLLAADIHITKSSHNTPSDRNNFYYCPSSDGSTYALGTATKNNVGIIMTDGTTQIVGTANSVWGSHTCAAIGESTGAISGWINTTGWQSWVKG